MPLRGGARPGCQSCPVSLTARSGAPAGQAPAAPLPLVVAGGAAGVAAAVFSYLALAVIALAAWMLDPSGSQEWTQMLEVASGAWLSGLGLSPTIGSVTLTLHPLGFAVLPVLALVAASRWAADASAVGRRGEALAVALSAGAGFAIVCAMIAALSRNLAISPVRAAAVGALVAACVTGVVVVRRSRAWNVDRLSRDVRVVVASTTAAVLSLVVAAGILLAFAVIVSFDDMTALLVQLDPGMSGLLLLAALTLGYLPVALIWSLAYLLGPGVTVSVGTVVSPYVDTATAALPGFPLLAVLPDTAPGGAILLPLLAVAAGALSGGLLRHRGYAGLRGCALSAATALSTGAVLALLAWLGSGSWGETTLQGLGPSPMTMALAGALAVALGALAVTAWPARRADG